MSKKLKSSGLDDQGERLHTHSSKDDPTERLPPKFCLRDMRPKYSLVRCNKDQKAAFAGRLFELSRSTWSQLRQMPRNGQGWEVIPQDAIKRGRTTCASVRGCEVPRLPMLRQSADGRVP